MRISCDYDGTGFISRFKTTVAWLTLKAISRNQVYGRKSADKGVHLKCHGLRISFKLSLFIRFLLLEDIKRTMFDMVKLKKPKAILWTHKDGKAAGKWTRSLLEVIR